MSKSLLQLENKKIDILDEVCKKLELNNDININTEEFNNELIENSDTVIQYSYNLFDFIINLKDSTLLNLEYLLDIMKMRDKKLNLFWDKLENILYISKAKECNVTLYSNGSYIYINEYEEKNDKMKEKIYYSMLEFLITTIHPLYCKEQSMCIYNEMFYLTKCRRIKFLKKLLFKRNNF